MEHFKEIERFISFIQWIGTMSEHLIAIVTVLGWLWQLIAGRDSSYDGPRWSGGQQFRLVFYGVAIMLLLMVGVSNATYLLYFKDFADHETPKAQVQLKAAIKEVWFSGAFLLLSLFMFIRVLREPKRGSDPARYA